MKIQNHLDSFKDQVAAATNPRKPQQLKEYTRAYLEGIESLVPVLPEDPTLAAMAFHDQIMFVKPRVAHLIFESDDALAEKWLVLKGSIALRPQAHAAVKALEEAELQHILVLAIVLNYKLNGGHRSKAQKEEDDESESELQPERERELEETEN